MGRIRSQWARMARGRGRHGAGMAAEGTLKLSGLLLDAQSRSQSRSPQQQQ